MNSTICQCNCYEFWINSVIQLSSSNLINLISLGFIIVIMILSFFQKKINAKINSRVLTLARLISGNNKNII